MGTKKKIVLLASCFFCMSLFFIWTSKASGAEQEASWETTDGTQQGSDWNSLVTYLEKHTSREIAITLLHNMEVNQPLSVRGSVKFNGRNQVKLTRNGDFDGPMILVCEDGILLMNESGLILDGTRKGGASSAAVLVEGLMKWNMGILQNNHNLSDPGNGGGFYVGKSGILYLNGGTIKGCLAAKKGGGVYNNGELYFSACTIADNHAMESGGGLYSTTDYRQSAGKYAGNTAPIGSAMSFTGKALVKLSGKLYLEDAVISLSEHSRIQVVAKMNNNAQPIAIQLEEAEPACGRALVEVTYLSNASSLLSMFTLQETLMKQGYQIRSAYSLPAQVRDEQELTGKHLFLSHIYQITYQMKEKYGTLEGNDQTKYWQEPLLLVIPQVTLKQKYFQLIGWIDQKTGKSYQNTDYYQEDRNLILVAKVLDKRLFRIRYEGSGAAGPTGETFFLQEYRPEEQFACQIAENSFGTYLQDVFYQGAFINHRYLYANGSFTGWNTDQGHHLLAGNLLTEEILEKLSLEEDEETRQLTLYAVWNQFPQVTLSESSFTLKEAQEGKITEQALMKQVEALDQEGECQTFLLDFWPEDYLVLQTPCMLTIPVGAKDDAGNRVVTSMIIKVGMETEQSFWRFISEEYLWEEDGTFLTEKKGGLLEHSLWKQGRRLELLKLYFTKKETAD